MLLSCSTTAVSLRSGGRTEPLTLNRMLNITELPAMEHLCVILAHCERAEVSFSSAESPISKLTPRRGSLRELAVGQFLCTQELKLSVLNCGRLTHPDTLAVHVTSLSSSVRALSVCSTVFGAGFGFSFAAGFGASFPGSFAPGLASAPLAPD